MKRLLLAWLLVTFAGALAACTQGEPDELTPEVVLQRMEGALYAEPRTLPSVRETAVQAVGNEEGPWFAVEAVFSASGDAARSTVTKPDDLALDFAEEMAILSFDDVAYYRFPDERAERDEGGQLLGSCAPEARTVVRRWFVCGLTVFTPNLVGTLTVTEDVSFSGREAVNLSWFESDNPAVAATVTTTVFFDAASFLPLGYIRDFENSGNGETAQIRASWEIEHVAAGETPGDYFDPAAFGYATPDERMTGELDSATVGPIYWLGREVSVPGVPALSIGWVRVDPAVHPERGAWASIEYGLSGREDHLRLEMWTPAGWDDFREMLAGLDSTFAEGCFEREHHAGGAFDVEIVRFRYGDRVAPVDGRRPEDMYTTGPCPDRPFDWAMAVVRFPDATVTFNAPIALGGRPPDGAFTEEASLRSAAEQLRLRQKGE